MVKLLAVMMALKLVIRKTMIIIIVVVVKNLKNIT